MARPSFPTLSALTVRPLSTKPAPAPPSAAPAVSADARARNRAEAAAEIARAQALAASGRGVAPRLRSEEARAAAAAKAAAAAASAVANATAAHATGGMAAVKSVDEVLLARKAALAQKQKAESEQVVDQEVLDATIAQHLSRQIFVTGPNNEAVPLIVRPTKEEFRAPHLLWERNKKELIAQGRYNAVPEDELRHRLETYGARRWGLLGRLFPWLGRFDSGKTFSGKAQKGSADEVASAAAAATADPTVAAILTAEQLVQTSMREALDRAQERGEKSPRPTQFPVKFFLSGLVFLVISWTLLILYDYHMEFQHGIAPPGSDYN